jgi:hypothetical protein
MKMSSRRVLIGLLSRAAALRVSAASSAFLGFQKLFIICPLAEFRAIPPLLLCPFVVQPLSLSVSIGVHPWSPAARQFTTRRLSLRVVYDLPKRLTFKNLNIFVNSKVKTGISANTAKGFTG